MSEPSSPQQEANAEPKPGPPNPAARGLDTPTPPGGPQRQDATGTDEVPDGREADDYAPAEGSSGSSTIPIEEEEPHPERSEASELQEENAGTSLDEPSEDLR